MRRAVELVTDGEDAVLPLAGPLEWQDLATLAGRARTRREDAVMRLVGVPEVGAVAVLTSVRPFGAGQPVAGMRVMRTATPWHGDGTFAVAALRDRLAREPEASAEVSLPPVQVAGGPDVAQMPPAQGWTEVGLVGPRETDGMEWDELVNVGQRVGEHDMARDVMIVAGMVHTAVVLGFVATGKGLPVAVAGQWLRLRGGAGFVVCRRSLL